MSGSQIVCCICHQSKLGWIHFDDAGWACRTCLDFADRVTQVYRINGIRFVKTIKNRSQSTNAKAATAPTATAS